MAATSADRPSSASWKLETARPPIRASDTARPLSEPGLIVAGAPGTLAKRGLGCARLFKKKQKVCEAGAVPGHAIHRASPVSSAVYFYLRSRAS
jgi:hypothetical protein